MCILIRSPFRSGVMFHEPSPHTRLRVAGSSKREGERKGGRRR